MLLPAGRTLFCAAFVVMGLFIAAETVMGQGAEVSGSADTDALTSGRELPHVSFAEFDRRAKAGERLNVVYLGGSLTWGANATDQQRTSYRALVGKWLQDRYPKAQIINHDAAIGGTGSRLGIFRLDRDVFPRDPDLLILDFTANDNIRSPAVDALRSYEAIVRRVISEASCPVMMVILPFMGDLDVDEALLVRREEHRKIARAYGCGFADAVGLMRGLYQAGQLDPQRIWDSPPDKAHPCDEGYRLFAQAVQEEFEAAVADGRVSRLPEKMLYGDQFMQTQRFRIAEAGPLPAGWTRVHANRVGAYFDMQPSRWLDDVALAKAGDVQPLTFRFVGNSVALFGESTRTSGKVRVFVDGEVVRRKDEEVIDIGHWGRQLGGNVRLYEWLVDGLAADVEHTLVVEPILEEGQELRFESVCVAGPGARVELVSAGPSND